LSERDREKWDLKYKNNPKLRETRPPSKLLKRYIKPNSRALALDLACGVGRNSLYLAENSWRVDAIDLSQVALDILEQRAKSKGLLEYIKTYAMDLDNFIPPNRSYDLIIKTNYLNRPLIKELKGSLKRGGMFIVESYMKHPDNEKRYSNEDYLLKSGELLSIFSDYQILEYKEYMNESYEIYKMAKAGVVAKRI